MIDPVDVTAVDRYIDMHGENHIVTFRDQEFYLYDLRDYLVDNRIALSLDNFFCTLKGIENDLGEVIIRSANLQPYRKDDIINL